MLLYYITDRKQFAGEEEARRKALLGKIAEAARCEVDFIQLREKDLAARDLESLAFEAMQVVHEAATGTRLLINSRVDVAISAKVDGVQLRSKDISPREVKTVYRRLGLIEPVVGVSCHDVDEVEQAAADGATFAVFAPVFEKQNQPGVYVAGLKKLAQACAQKIPVFALGGVTFDNAVDCLHADVAGIAGIRLFQEHDICETVSQLRSIS